MLTQIYYLLLPSFPLVFVLFGYIARMARAGTVEALDADYTRTAVLKGLTRRTVLWRHVLRNALLPTITVIATQMGYLIGGLVVVEVLFHYDGIGSLIYIAARGKDFPMLEAGILTEIAPAGTTLKRALEVANQMAVFDPKSMGLLRRFGRESAEVHSRHLSEHAVALMSVMLAERNVAH